MKATFDDQKEKIVNVKLSAERHHELRMAAAAANKSMVKFARYIIEFHLDYLKAKKEKKS